jgi:hypothetical protein
MNRIICLLLATANFALAGNGILELHSDTVGAEVLVDGKKKGIIPEGAGLKLSMELLEGDHEIELKKEGFDSIKKTIFIGEGVTQPLTLHLKPTLFVNSLGMKFAPVKGTPVLFNIWETRVQDFRAFVTESGYDYKAGDVPFTVKDGKWGQHPDGGWDNPGFPQTEEHPVVCVSWLDAVAFCEWLTKRERASGKIPADSIYRLPTDHEWSCAAGIGGQEDEKATPKTKNGVVIGYLWGANWPPPPGTGNYDAENIAGYEDNHISTAPVGSYKPTAEGLYDLSGNVLEWCQDWYDPSDTKTHVLRGASWRDSSEVYARSSFRIHDLSYYRSRRRGFRVVLMHHVSP